MKIECGDGNLVESWRNRMAEPVAECKDPLIIPSRCRSYPMKRCISLDVAPEQGRMLLEGTMPAEQGLALLGPILFPFV